MRVFWKAEDRPCQILKVAPVPQVVLLVGMTISGAVLTGVAELKAVPKLAKTNRL